MVTVLLLLLVQDRTGALAGKLVKMDLSEKAQRSGKAKEEGKSARVRIPPRYRVPLLEEKAVVLEDGVELPMRAVAIRQVADSGSGRYRVRGALVYFSASDATHPLENGRSYEFKIPRPVRPVVLNWALALSLLSLALMIWRAPPPTIERQPSITTWAVLIALFSVGVSAWAWNANRELSDGFLMVKGMPYSDAMGWNELAISLKEGRGFTGDFSCHRPGYSLFLGCVYTFFGDGLVVARVVNVLLIALASVVVFLMARGLGGRLLGLAAVAFFATHRELHEMVVFTMTENVGFAFGLLSFFLLWLACCRPSWWLFLLAGLFFGMANLSRPMTLLAAVGFAVVMFMQMPRWSFREVMTRGAVLASGLLIVFLPWSIRQKMEIDTFSPSINSSIMMYSGATPEIGHTGALAADHYYEAERAGIPRRTAEWNEFYKEKYRAKVAEDPGRYLGLMTQNLYEFFGSFDLRRPEIRALLLGFAILCIVRVAWSERCLPLLVLIPLGIFLEPWLTAVPPGFYLLAVVILTRWRAGTRQVVFLRLSLSTVIGVGLLSALVANFALNRAEPLVSWMLIVPILFGILTLCEFLAEFVPPRWRSVGRDQAEVPTRALLIQPVKWAAAGLLALVGVGLLVMGAKTLAARGEDRSHVELTESQQTQALDWYGGDIDDLFLEPITMSEYRVTLAANEDAHWAPEFEVRPYSRALVFVRIGVAKNREHGLWGVNFPLSNHSDEAFEKGKTYVLIGRKMSDLKTVEALALIPLSDSGDLDFGQAQKFTAPESS